MLTVLVVGLIAGWLAGLIYKGSGFGVIGNIILGLVGALLGGLLANLFGMQPTDLLGSITVATIGAIVLLVVVNAVSMRGKPL